MGRYGYAAAVNRAQTISACPLTPFNANIKHCVYWNFWKFNILSAATKLPHFYNSYTVQLEGEGPERESGRSLFSPDRGPVSVPPISCCQWPPATFDLSCVAERSRSHLRNWQHLWQWNHWTQWDILIRYSNKVRNFKPQKHFFRGII